MKRNFYIGIVLSIVTSLFFVSCKPEKISNPDPLAGLTKVGEGYALGAATKVELYSTGSTLYSGYTQFKIRLLDSITGNKVEQARIQLSPLMDMGTMRHASPFENPSSESAVNTLYPCSVTFIMSSMGGTWTLGVNVSNLVNNKQGVLTIPITVQEPTKSRIKSFISASDGQKYFVALVQPSSPKVGINDFELAVYKKLSMMSFPADSTLRISNTPEMPTMGHGSPNNIDPAHTALGHYKGKVNFTMTGLWKLNLDMYSGTAVADTTQYFEIEF